jgi:hypothetical protein
MMPPPIIAALLLFTAEPQKDPSPDHVDPGQDGSGGSGESDGDQCEQDIEGLLRLLDNEGAEARASECMRKHRGDRGIMTLYLQALSAQGKYMAMKSIIATYRHYFRAIPDCERVPESNAHTQFCKQYLIYLDNTSEFQIRMKPLGDVSRSVQLTPSKRPRRSAELPLDESDKEASTRLDHGLWDIRVNRNNLPPLKKNVSIPRQKVVEFSHCPAGQIQTESCKHGVSLIAEGGVNLRFSRAGVRPRASLRIEYTGAGKISTRKGLGWLVAGGSASIGWSGTWTDQRVLDPAGDLLSATDRVLKNSLSLEFGAWLKMGMGTDKPLRRAFLLIHAPALRLDFSSHSFQSVSRVGVSPGIPVRLAAHIPLGRKPRSGLRIGGGTIFEWYRPLVYHLPGIVGEANQSRFVFDVTVLGTVGISL